MHTIRLICNAMVLALALHMVPLLSASDPKLSSDLRNALNQAATLRVELAADLLFGLIDSGRVPKDTSLEYLERLYYRASEAQRSYPLISVPRRDPNTKASEFPHFLSQLGATRHDIQVRALLRMAVLDKERARRLLTGLLNDAPPIEANCGQNAIPVFSHNVYPRLLSVFPEDFNDIVHHISTPQQSAAVIESIQALKDLRGRVGTA